MDHTSEASQTLSGALGALYTCLTMGHGMQHAWQT